MFPVKVIEYKIYYGNIYSILSEVKMRLQQSELVKSSNSKVNVFSVEDSLFVFPC